MQKYIKMKLKIKDKYFFNPNDKKYKLPSWVKRGEIYHMTQRGSGREEPILYFGNNEFVSVNTDKQLLSYKEIIDSGKEIMIASLFGMYYHKSRRMGNNYTMPMIYGTGGEHSRYRTGVDTYDTPGNNLYSSMWKIDLETGGLNE